MKTYSFLPKGVCARKIDFEMDAEGRLHNVKFTGGCPGNLLAIGKLVEGRGTSCADQLSLAIDAALQER